MKSSSYPVDNHHNLKLNKQESKSKHKDYESLICEFTLSSKEKEQLKYIYSLFMEFHQLILSQNDEELQFENKLFIEKLENIQKRCKDYKFEELFKNLENKNIENRNFLLYIIDKMNLITSKVNELSNAEKLIKHNVNTINFPSLLEKKINDITKEISKRKIFDAQFEGITECINNIILQTELQRRKK